MPHLLIIVYSTLLLKVIPMILEIPWQKLQMMAVVVSVEIYSMLK